MDFEQAKAAHFDWKAKLKAYIAKPDGSLKPDIVSQDNQCMLGKWLYAEGKAHAALPEYKELVTHHATFHKCAGSIIAKADKGEKVSEEVALGTQSPYNVASANVTAAIVKLQKLVKA